MNTDIEKQKFPGYVFDSFDLVLSVALWGGFVYGKYECCEKKR